MIPTVPARRSVPIVLLVVGFAFSAAAQTQEAPVLEPGVARAEAYGRAAETLVARIAALARHTDGAGITELVIRVLSDPTLAPAARERVLYESAMALAQMDASPSTRSLLDTLAARPPEVRVWHDDDAHRVAVPLYDVASAARYASRRQAEERAAAAALAALATTDEAPLRLYDAQGDPAAPDARGVTQAFERAPLEQLRPYRDALATSAAQGARLELAEVVARRLGDAALMQVVLTEAAPASALAIVRTARTSFPAQDAFDLLAVAARRDDVASAALLEIGRLAYADSRARDFLFDALGDAQRAGSAAAALASTHDERIAADLRAWVLEQPDVTLARRGILALRLDASASARAELSRLAADPDLAAELRAEALR